MSKARHEFRWPAPPLAPEASADALATRDSRLHVRVLLDTGPDRTELAHVRRLFAEVGASVEVEGHSYGGPPPTSMFLIVVSVPLLPFLARFRAPEESPAALASLVQRLHRMRADPSRWGRPHTVVIEDVWSEVTIRCPSGLPERAYGDLLLLDLSGFGPDSPTVTVSWDGRSSAWWARLDSGPCPVLRRIPLDTGPTRRPPSVTGIGPGEVEQVRALANGGTDSAIRWQRANVVLLSIMGWNISAIARKTLLSPDRVRSLLEHVERAGIAALDPGCRGERAYRPTAEQTHEAVAIALTAPTDSDVTASASGTGWDRDTLAEHLVRAGIVEDVTAEWLDEVMRSSGRPPERGPDEPADLR